MQTDISSKLIEAVKYQEDSGLLRIFMTNGQIREFEEVPRDTVDRFVTAKSPGSFYISEIRGRFHSPEDI